MQGFIDDVYVNWKARYLQQAYQGRIYINFNLAQDSQPLDAVTTSESIGCVSGGACDAQILRWHYHMTC